MEMLFAKLENWHGRPVILVRPSFGNQSDSWVGDLLVYDNTTDVIKFQIVSSTGLATIFGIEDIKSTELLKESVHRNSESVRFVITLKGPKDY